MATYIIGDVQGCYRSLQGLLETVAFGDKDTLWLAGDLVNRGPRSLETLEFVMSLGDRAVTILGNHDLYLLALYYRAWPSRPAHTLGPVLNNPNVERIIEWLRHRPLVHIDHNKQYAMIHAGLYPLWTMDQAATLADEVSQILRSDHCGELLETMYGNNPNHWQDNLEDPARSRFIVNALTRMRYVDDNGRLDLHHKEPPQHSPNTLKPWFEHAELTLPQGMTLCFGHWASLQGQCPQPQIESLDTGCVWGNTLTAYRIEDSKRFSVQNLD